MVSMHYIIVFCTTQMNYVIAKKKYDKIIVAVFYISVRSQKISCVSESGIKHFIFFN